MALSQLTGRCGCGMFATPRFPIRSPGWRWARWPAARGGLQRPRWV